MKKYESEKQDILVNARLFIRKEEVEVEEEEEEEKE